MGKRQSATAFRLIMGLAMGMLSGQAGHAQTSTAIQTSPAQSGASRPAAQARPAPKPAKIIAPAKPGLTPVKPQARTAALRLPTTRSQGAAGGLSCVPYVRMVTGMAVSGNGGQWWHNAAGLYDRGRRPEPGAVMVFRASGGMSRGHVAVVRDLVGPRQLRIDHANWAGPGIRRGTVMRNVAVIDVSDANDWSEVRVQVGHDPGTFGRTYPLHGFLYNRPGAMQTAARPAAGQLSEVAEAPRR